MLKRYSVGNNRIKPHWSVKTTRYFHFVIYGLILGFFILPSKYRYIYTENIWEPRYIYSIGFAIYYMLLYFLIIILELVTPWSIRKGVLRVICTCLTALSFFYIILQFTAVSPEYYEPMTSRRFYQIDYGTYIQFILFPVLMIYYVMSTIAHYKTT